MPRLKIGGSCKKDSLDAVRQLDPEELEQTAPESNWMIEVHEFVKTEQIGQAKAEGS